MQSGDEAFDDRTSDQLERAYAGEDFGSEEPNAGTLRLDLNHGRRRSPRARWISDLKVATGPSTGTFNRCALFRKKETHLIT
jgi:hypothetical protein